MAEKPKLWVTAADVARRAGVSRSAVSRAFTPGASITRETKDRVMKASKELGYQVDILARGMIQQRNNLIGIVTAGLDDPFHAKLLAPLIAALNRNQLSPIVMNAESPEETKTSLEILLSYRIAGLIMTSGSLSLELARQYLKCKVPITMINRAPEGDGADAVVSDFSHGSTFAAQMLHEIRAIRPAYIGPNELSYSGQITRNAFVRTTKKLNRGHSVNIFATPGDDYLSGMNASFEVLTRPSPPDGVFCASDLLAMGFMDVARARFKLTIPSDVAVIGFDDIPAAGYETYQLSTIAQDTSALASSAVEMLTDRIAHFDQPSRTRIVPVSCMMRASHRRHTTGQQ